MEKGRDFTSKFLNGLRNKRALMLSSLLVVPSVVNKQTHDPVNSLLFNDAVVRTPSQPHGIGDCSGESIHYCPETSDCPSDCG